MLGGAKTKLPSLTLTSCVKDDSPFGNHQTNHLYKKGKQLFDKNKRNTEHKQSKQPL